MTSKLGTYWSVMHRRPQDYAFFKQQQPTVFKIMDGGVPDYQWARDNLPNSLIIARDWALSEQHSDMLKDAAGTGRRHAQEWNGHWQRLGFDKGKTLILGINEPKIWDAGVPEALRVYTIALCEEATKLGLHVGAMQLSVGWPNNDGPDTPPNWSAWHGVDNAIRANNGALVVHEYWADQGPEENWGWWAGRVLKCPWQVPIIIGECGIDMYVKDGGVQHESRGWRGRKTPEQYAAELADYTGRMSADSRFVGCAVFTCDYANGEWASFDVEPAYNAILATPIPTPPPIDPPINPPGTIYTGVVTATAGVNVRSGPSTDATKLGTLTAGSTVLYDSEDNGWLHLVPGYVSAEYVAEPSTQTVHIPTVGTGASTDSDCWQKAIEFVLKQEGGLSTDPNDPGNYVNGKFVGTNFGISANAHPNVDIVNLTKEQAKQIYWDSYWIPSGASQLEFPLCLAVMDLAVNGGVGRAKEALQATGHDFTKFMAWRIAWYTRLEQFPLYGQAWIRRCADLLLEASK